MFVNLISRLTFIAILSQVVGFFRTGNLLNIYMLISPLNGHSRKTEQNKKKPLTLASEVKYLTTQHSLFCIKKCLTKISQVTDGSF